MKHNLDLALANMSQGLLLFDEKERLRLSNDNAAIMLGLKKGSLRRGMTLTSLLCKMHADTSLSPAEVSAKASRARQRQLERIKIPGEVVKSEARWNGRSYALTHCAMSQGGWVTTIEDITERLEIEARITHLAHYDVLTVLPNRTHFRNTLHALLNDPHTHRVAILYIDLDRFKPINDTYGHSMGDRVLKIAAQRMQSQLHRGDLAARLGGDEFAVISRATTHQEINELADRLVDELNHAVSIDGLRIQLSVSIGIAIAPDHGENPDTLLRNADMALYRAKEDGHSCHRTYDTSIEEPIKRRREMEQALRDAIANGELSVHFQPIIHTHDGRLCGFEALARWHSPTYGAVPPTDFIAFAEEIGIIAGIDEWVLRQACREALTWPDALIVSVNLSSLEFCTPDLASRIHRILTEEHFQPRRLELEITETAIVRDAALAAATLHKLRELGILIALDDFGTGYSSLSHLRTMPLTRIKIDRSFVHDLDQNPEAQAIIRAVISIGDGIGVAVTAEGVETEKQAYALSQLGCSDLQGFYICQPMEGSAASKWIQSHQSGNCLTSITSVHDGQA